MKLIIDIPKGTYEAVKVGIINQVLEYKVWNAIKDGTPLDDVKEQMKKTRCFHVGTFEDDNPIDYGIVEGFDKAIAILDNIGKAESEGK